MNKFKLFSIIVLVFFASYSFAQWSFVGGVTGAGTFPSISVVDATTVFIGGGPSGVAAVFKSTNGGVAFTPVTTTGITLELFCIWAKDVNTIFGGDGGAAGGAGGNAHVWKTTSGGAPWTSILSTGGSVGFINGVVFSRTTPLNGYAQSDPPTSGGVYWVQKTTDGGNTWTLQNPPSLGSGWASGQNTPFIIDDTFYGFGTSGPTSSLPKSYMTSNGGTSWYSAILTGAPVGSTQHFCSNVSFNTNKINGVAGSSNTSTTCSRTTNGGVSWFSQTIPSSVTTGYFNAKFVPGTNVVFIIVSSASATQSFRSNDNGATWTSLTWPSGVNSCTHMDLYYTGGTAYLYAVCADGSVVKLTQTITGINEPSTSTPNDYKLEQNYPNPFNPSTTINYSVPKASFVTLKVYDVLGNEVKTVVNEYQPADNYSYNVNFSDLTSGIYYYTLNAGSYTATKKLTFVK